MHRGIVPLKLAYKEKRPRSGLSHLAHAFNPTLSGGILSKQCPTYKLIKASHTVGTQKEKEKREQNLNACPRMILSLTDWQVRRLVREVPVVIGARWGGGGCIGGTYFSKREGIWYGGILMPRQDI